MDWLLNNALPMMACIFIVWMVTFNFFDKIMNWNVFKNFGLVGGLIFAMYATGFIQDAGSDIARAAEIKPRHSDLGEQRAGASAADLVSSKLTKVGDGPPKLAYWHLWADDDGITHHTRCEYSGFKSESVGGKAAPEWIANLLTSNAKVVFFVQPVGWFGDWHPNPKPQWLVTLSGRWFTETMDGVRVEMGPGDVQFGNDQTAKPDAQGRFGHLSGTVGDEPLAILSVQLEGDEWIGLKPCHFK